ncbi:hypothetical protein DFH27DRAFT_38915 [Peziza echinospora]|nr:hypothetical protein DFH27DRAFT_38915 [Peziza echinospora]
MRGSQLRLILFYISMGLNFESVAGWCSIRKRGWPAFSQLSTYFHSRILKFRIDCPRFDRNDLVGFLFGDVCDPQRPRSRAIGAFGWASSRPQLWASQNGSYRAKKHSFLYPWLRILRDTGSEPAPLES